MHYYYILHAEYTISLIYFIRKYFAIQKHFLNKKKFILLQENDSNFKTNSISKKPLKDDRIFAEKARGKREHSNDATPLISGET